MGYNSNRLSNTGCLDGVDILIVDQDTARRGIIEFIQKSEYCGFSAAGGPNYCNFGASRDCEVEVFENESVRMISEVDIFKADGATTEYER